MYNKQEASAARQKFWTRFGQYMAPVPSAAGENLNWVNYRTGVKGIRFRMDADNNRAVVTVEISLPSLLAVFVSFKKQFEMIAGKNWYTETTEAGTVVAMQLNGVNIFRETDWPAVISFLKESIMNLDRFWQEFKPAFE